MIKLSKHIAMHIAKEISELIHQHVNVMDHLGYIVASTDEERIGNFHEGAQVIIHEKLNCLIIEEDDDYRGAKKGINLPIVVEDEIIGVIGITGDREQVEIYGQIIKKMTEILVVEAQRKQIKEENEKIRSRYLEEWLFDGNVAYDKAFIDRGEAIGIDIIIPRRILIMTPLLDSEKGHGAKDQIFLNHLEKKMKSWVEEERQGNLFLRSRNKLIGFVVTRSDEEMVSFAKALENWIKTTYEVRLAIGIDKIQGDWTSMYLAYTCAKKALGAAKLDSQNPIKLYEEMTVELFTGEIPKVLKEEYINKVFKGISDSEVKEMLELVEMLINCNGSITLASERLFMHKNTLQYKLNRIFEKTGHNPRDLKDIPTLYMANVFFRQIKK